MNSINHVAIIMDGNGRWGLKRNKSRNFGHRAGLVTVENIIKHTIKKKIKYLTLFAFSTENWKRPKKEIKFLFSLLEEFIIKKLDVFQKEDIKLKIIGSKIKLKKIESILNKAQKKTNNNKRLQINLALNYGSKNEIIDSVKKLIKNKEIINIKNIDKNLYTKFIPKPDILIRTGNTNRISNFLLWQIAYTEIYFEKKLWPDFKVKDYDRIINDFKNVKRNYGNI